MPVPMPPGRNLCALMRERLPATVLQRLQDTGRLARQSGVTAYVVGGLVRDLLLGRPTMDVDITVEGDGMVFAHRLADRNGAGLKIFERFATASVVFPDGFKLDVATARRENYVRPGALPAVSAASIEDDLARRDFTINALAMALNARRFGEMMDVHGGLRDLQRKTIRVLHDRSFEDDPTRLFRAIRFEQRFGFRIETSTLRLLKAAVVADLAQELSGPRLRNEVMLLLAEPHPRRAIRRMAHFDLLRCLHPRLMMTPQMATLLKKTAPALAWWTQHFPDRALDRPLLYLMALMEDLTEPDVGAVVTRLTLPTRQADKIRMMKKRPASTLRAPAAGRSITPSQAYRVFAGLPDEGLALLAARHNSTDIRPLLSAYVTSAHQATPSLTGTDLTAMGLTPGPLYKTILDRLRDARLNGTVTSDADERVFVKTFVKTCAEEVA